MSDMRLVEVTAAVAEPGYVADLTFSDGTRKKVCLRPLLSGDVFEPMLNERIFEKLHVDEEIGTISWPNGADLSPETLYSLPEVTAGGRRGAPPLSVAFVPLLPSADLLSHPFVSLPDSSGIS